MSSSDIAAPSSVRFFSWRSFLAWLVCLTAGLFFFYEFIQMHMFNAIRDSLMVAFDIDAEQLGHLSAAYFWADVIFLFPAGMMLDRFSTRKVILISMFVCVLGTVVFSQTSSILAAGICRFATGIGNAFCFLACIRLATRWFPPHRMALVTGLIVTEAMLGGVMAQTPLLHLTEALGWRHALLAVAGFGVILWLLIFAIVRDCPPEHESLEEEQQTELQRLGFGVSIKAALKNAQNWLAGLYTSLLNLPLMLLGGLWGISYLVDVHHLSKDEASHITMFLFLGTIIGGPVVGWISDKLGQRKKPMLVGALLSTAILAYVLLTPHLNYLELMLSFFLIGLVTSTQVITYPLVAESNRPAFTGTAVGWTSLLIMGGPAVAEPLFGKLLQLSSHHTVANGIATYTSHDYFTAMLIFPVGCLVGLILSFFLKETWGQLLTSTSKRDSI